MCDILRCNCGANNARTPRLKPQPMPTKIDVLIEQLVEPVAERVAEEVSPQIAEAVRRGRLPTYLRTSHAVTETGLSARSLKQLRETSQLSFHKQAGVILYRTHDLLRELDELRIPRKNEPASKTTSP